MSMISWKKNIIAKKNLTNFLKQEIENKVIFIFNLLKDKIYAS